MRQLSENKSIGFIRRNPQSPVSERFGVGFEKLDRNAFDPSDKYDKLAALGVKWVRILSGWEKTEKIKGVYDFSWLEEVVDRLSANGLTAWICLCYGNPLYTESAKKVFGSVGCPPIFSNEEKNAWLAYCKALARKFKGKVKYYEIWNEPDGVQCWKHGTSAIEYSEFCKSTAAALKEVDGGIYIVGGALGVSERWACYLKKALENGMAENLNAISFHHYAAYPEANLSFINQLKDLIYEYKPLEIIHGENGCPSSIDGNGSLHACNWTERRQAAYLLRNMIVDIKCGVKFSSWFSFVDMMEGLFGTRDDVSTRKDYGYYGLLGAEFNENGEAIGNFNPKKSYYAYQNLAAALGGEFRSFEFPKSKPYPLHWSFETGDFDESGDDFVCVGLKRKNGAQAFCYYKPVNILSTEFDSTVSFIFQNVSEDMKIVDLLSGEVYAVSKDNIEIRERYGDCCVEVKGLPVKDYPLLLTFGDFCDENIQNK